MRDNSVSAHSLARVAVACGLFLHLVFMVGFAFSFFPPSMFLVRGEPATLQPGLENVFPALIALVYAALSSSMAYGFYSNTPQAIIASAISCLVYHMGGISLYVFGKASQALNPEQATVPQIIALHSMLGLPSLLSILLCHRSREEKMDKKSN